MQTSERTIRTSGFRLSPRRPLRTLEARTQETLVEAIGQALDAVSGRDVVGWFAHCAYRLSDQLA
jgi:hypothetical protein